MKRLLAACLAALMLFTLVGCEEETKQDPLVKSYQDSARQYIANNDLDAAIAVLEEGVEKTNGNPELVSWLEQVKTKKGELQGTTPTTESSEPTEPAVEETEPVKAELGPDGYGQKIVVTAIEEETRATLTLYEWQDGEWEYLFACDATVGSKGISSNYGEGKKRTPLGVFKLGVAFSANALPNKQWPTEIVTEDTCVVSDKDSPLYNTIQKISQLPEGVKYESFTDSLLEDEFNVMLFVEHNGDGYSNQNVVAGKGSNITICGKKSDIKATSGCIDISASDMLTLIHLLDYSKNPHLETIVEEAPDEYVGVWYDTYEGELCVTTEKTKDTYYIEAIIESIDTEIIWTMTAVNGQDSNLFSWDSKAVMNYLDENGNVVSSEVLYEDGEADFWFYEDKVLCWEDYTMDEYWMLVQLEN